MQKVIEKLYRKYSVLFVLSFSQIIRFIKIGL